MTWKHYALVIALLVLAGLIVFTFALSVDEGPWSFGYTWPIARVG